MLEENEHRWTRPAYIALPLTTLLLHSYATSYISPPLNLLTALCTPATTAVHHLRTTFAMLSRVLPGNAPPWLRSTPLNNLDIDFQLLRNRLLRSYSSIANSTVTLSDESIGPHSGNKISNLTFYDLKSAWT